MKSSESAMSSMSSMSGGASALTSSSRTAAKDDAAPISRGWHDEQASGPSARQPRFADLLGDELSLANDALPASVASPAIAEKKDEREKEDASDPDARAVALAQPLPPPHDAPFGMPFAWPTAALVDVKRSVLPANEARPPDASKAKSSLGDAGDAGEAGDAGCATVGKPSAAAATDDDADASALLGPALPQLGNTRTGNAPAPARASDTDAQPVAAAEPAGPDAIPVPAQMTLSATPVATTVTIPTSGRRPGDVTPSALPAVTAPSRHAPVAPARGAPAPAVSAAARSPAGRDAGSSAAPSSPSSAVSDAVSGSPTGSAGGPSASPAASTASSASRSMARGAIGRAGAGDEPSGAGVNEERRAPAEELPTAAALTPFTPAPVIFPSSSGAVASGSLTAAPGKAQAGGLAAESSGEATANAIRNAEAVGHRRVLAGDAHGALSVGELGRFEVSAKTQDDGRVDVHVRAEQHAGAALLEHHAAELRADVRIEIPRAFVAVQDSPAAQHGSSGGATNGGAQSRTSERDASSQNERGSGDARGERGGAVAIAPVAAPKPSSNKRLARVKIVL